MGRCLIIGCGGVASVALADGSDVAELVGIDRSAYSRYETGTRGMTVELLCDIAATLGVTADRMNIFFKDK